MLRKGTQLAESRDIAVFALEWRGGYLHLCGIVVDSASICVEDGSQSIEGGDDDS